MTANSGWYHDRSQDAPAYKPGLYACLACSILNVVLVGVLDIAFYFQNKKADRGEISIEAHEVRHAVQNAGISDFPVHQANHTTPLQDDSQSNFRYTY